ncbi:F-box/LRR-repeat protein 14 [Belonocnema kinseyi]|uniref:F-box/LRR-repeat protein 14 n=1 Tax=Belonocnema kinseyi TaxID=2817044 RepID=UPI00143DD435|nr:F-box/LRR-repeat protein 14 [Belonocnema kinseyi]
MEEGQLMTELPAVTPTRGATLIHRSGHCYQLHRPHLVVSSPLHKKQKPTDEATDSLDTAAAAVAKVVAAANTRQESGTITATKRSAPTSTHLCLTHIEGPTSKRPRIQTTTFCNTSTNVSNLYPEILAHIFSYLDVRERGRAAQVCSAWRDAAYHKSVWRGVEARLHLRRQAPALFTSLVRRGIRRVQVLSLKKGLGEVFKGMPNLEALSLSGCFNFTDTGLTNALSQEFLVLAELDLSLCKQVTDASVGKIAQYLKNLEKLNLGGCGNISNTGLMLIAWGLKKLKKLDLRSCWHISDNGIAHLAGLNKDSSYGNLPLLEHLGLQDCQKLSDESLRYVSVGLTTLKSINLSFSCFTDSGMKYLAKMPSLQELDLRSCDNISEIGMAYLAEGGSRISSLDVSFCDKIGDQALVHISQGLFNLKFLSLSACQVSDEGICKIAKSLQDLETLNIGQCSKLTDKGLHTIADSMKHLKCIDLYGCTRITTNGLERIMKLPQLSTLNLGLWHVR